jgi:hypothetical protein
MGTTGGEALQDSLGTGAAGGEKVDFAPVAGGGGGCEGEDVVARGLERHVVAHEDAAAKDDEGRPADVEKAG